MALLATLAIAEQGAEARAQSSSRSTAAVSAQIIDAVAISRRAAGASISVAAPLAGVVMADLTGSAYAFQTPAGQVVSIAILPPSVMRRAGGPQRIALGRRVQPWPSSLSSTAVYIPVRMTVPVTSDAAAGLYAGDAMVVMNLN